MKENISTTSKSGEKTVINNLNTQAQQNKNVLSTGSMEIKKTIAVPLLKDEEKVNEEVLNTFDFSAIDKMDPSLTDGFKKIADKVMDAEINFIEMDKKPEKYKEKIRFRLFCQGEEVNAKNVKYEIFSDFDFFFIYYNMYNWYHLALT